jgi:hypothetical protein
MLGFRILFGRASKLGIGDAEFCVFAACKHWRIDGTSQTRDA